MRIRRVVLAVLAMLLVSLALTAAPAAAANGEGWLVTKMNAERASQGLAPLEVYWDLVDDARTHSKVMREQDDLHHNSNLSGVTSNWLGLGENVGVGPTVASLHQAFMASSGHRTNVLGDFNYVGVGVVKESDTKLWVTVVFMRGPAGLVSPPAPEPPASEPEPPAPEPPSPTSAAPASEPSTPVAAATPSSVAAAPAPAAVGAFPLATTAFATVLELLQTLRRAIRVELLGPPGGALLF